MNKIATYFTQAEPQMLWLGVRALVYLILGATGVALGPDEIELYLAPLAVLFGIDTATSVKARSQVYSPKTATDLVSSIFIGEVGEFLRATVEGAVPKNKLTEGLRATAPLLIEFAQANLTTEMRGKIQAKAHRILRDAGLMKKRNVGTITGLLVMLSIVVILPGCTLVTDFFGSTVDVLAGDSATLTVADTGLRFDPGAETAVAVVITIYADALGLIDERCEVTRPPDPAEGEEPEPIFALCDLGSVPEPTIVTLAAEGVTADATWTRPGSARPYGTQLR